ncbi:MAG: protoporphyrinogen oxidase [Opitutales bacterium]|nr:protoporphyrinogen oxidase [Opitutales bacterium]
MAKKILIIGGGISGLCAAHALKQKGFEVLLLESANRAGGVINTFNESGFRAESGSNSVMVQSQKTLDFIESLGLKDRVAHSSAVSKKRFFVKNGKICEVPMGPLKMIFSPLFSLAGKFRLLKEMKVPRHNPDSDPSVAQFTIDRLGREALDYGMNPFMAGIYGGDPERLSMKHAFPPFWNLEQKYGSIIKGASAARKEKIAAGNFFKPVMISFKNGLVELVDKIKEGLKNEIILNAKVVSVDYDMGSWQACWTNEMGDGCDVFDEIILALPAPEVKKLPLAGTLSGRLEVLGKIEYAPVVSFTMGFKRSDISHKLDGFGALVPELEKKYRILGALFVSSVFEGRAPADCATITCYIGGMRSPGLFEKSDAELEQIVLEDLRGLVGLGGKPLFKRIFRWRHAIAQYNVGYGDILAEIEEIEKDFPTVKLLGAYRGGVGVSSCIENALALADKIRQ